MGALAGDVDYRERFSSAFRRRRLHPSTEMRVWDYVVGKPAERVQLSADVTTSQKLDQERELFRKLSIDQLEMLAAESQALVNKAIMLVKENALTSSVATRLARPLRTAAAAIRTARSTSVPTSLVSTTGRCRSACGRHRPRPVMMSGLASLPKGRPAEAPTSTIRSGKLQASVTAS